MAIRTITIRTCDAPRCRRFEPLAEYGGRLIQDNEEFLDAGVYGAAFHVACWWDMGADEAAKALNIDDIEFSNSGKRAWDRGV
jgi:hypothetical protein